MKKLTVDDYRKYILENVPDLPISAVNVEWLANRMADFADDAYDRAMRDVANPPKEWD